jgi:hypothetical protein
VASRASRCLCVVLLASAACAVSCSEGTEPAGEASETAAHPAPGVPLEPDAAPALEAELIEQLGAIGYLAGSEPAGAPTGVVTYDPERVEPGLNLLTSGHGPVALLMDMSGEVLHEWRAEFAQVFPNHPDRDRAREPHRNFWRDAVLFPNGDLLVIWELFGLFKLDRDSRVLWAVADHVHHDLLVTEAGEIAHLQAKRRMIPGIQDKKAIEDYIVVRDAGGRELRRLAMSDALRNADWLELRRAFWLRALDRGYELSGKGLYDPFHTNSLRLLSETEAARLGEPFRAGDALISLAMLDTIALLDMETGTARWWQQGPFGMQHQPQPTPDGGIILFNNFLTAERSSVVTLDPNTGRVIREYTGPEAEPLYSRRSGRVQVLRNGNVLIVETDGGRALEVTPAGELVWQYRSPYLAGKNGDLVAHLYSLDRVDATQTRWLTGEPLSWRRTRGRPSVATLAAGDELAK